MSETQHTVTHYADQLRWLARQTPARRVFTEEECHVIARLFDAAAAALAQAEEREKGLRETIEKAIDIGHDKNSTFRGRTVAMIVTLQAALASSTEGAEHVQLPRPCHYDDPRASLARPSPCDCGCEAAS